MLLAFWMSVFVGMKYLSGIYVQFYYVYREVQKSLSDVSFSNVGCLVQAVTDEVWF